MKIFIARKFEWWEISLLKLCVMSFGILVALYFHDVVAELDALWWVLTVLPALYFIARIIRE